MHLVMKGLTLCLYANYWPSAFAAIARVPQTTLCDAELQLLSVRTALRSDGDVQMWL
jgi:hypothetical protein